eukprot:3907160-Prymnesium_polylepis.1
MRGCCGRRVAEGGCGLAVVAVKRSLVTASFVAWVMRAILCESGDRVDVGGIITEVCGCMLCTRACGSALERGQVEASGIVCMSVYVWMFVGIGCADSLAANVTVMGRSCAQHDV